MFYDNILVLINLIIWYQSTFLYYSIYLENGSETFI